MIGRPWLQFSLKGFLLLLTVACIGIGWKAERARRQRLAVAAIEAAGGLVQYDWQPDIVEWHTSNGGTVRYQPVGGGPSAPWWLRRIVGDDFFQVVRSVVLRRLDSYWYRDSSGEDWISNGFDRVQDRQLEEDGKRLLPHLRALPGLKAVYIDNHEAFGSSYRLKPILQQELPDCRIERLNGMTASAKDGPSSERGGRDDD